MHRQISDWFKLEIQAQEEAEKAWFLSFNSSLIWINSNSTFTSDIFKLGSQAFQAEKEQ